MPTWLVNKALWIGMAIVAGVMLLCAGTFAVYRAGGNARVAAQDIAQIKHDNKVRSSYAKIIKNVPDSDDDAAVSVFLLSHAASGGR